LTHVGDRPADKWYVADGEDLDPAVLARLLPYLTEAISVIGPDGTITANLTPPGGLLGHGDRIGTSAFEYYHPDDMPAALELGVSALQTEPGWMGAGILRARKADGTYEKYEMTVVNHTDDPVLQGFVCRLRSIEGFDTSIYNVPNHDELLESIAEAVPVAIVLLDPFGLPLYLNQEAKDLLGTDLAKLRERGLPPAVGDQVKVRLGKPGTSSIEYEDCGRVLSVRLVSRGKPGRVASVVMTFGDVTELSRRANHDALTGLPNRAAVLDALSSRLMFDPMRVTAIYCDLDGFKLVNDRFGHAVGDRVLAQVAGVLRGAVRDGDIVGRIGGDEFVFVCDDLDDAALVAVSDRITSGLALAGSPDAPDISVSLGVARGRPGDTARDLLHRADVAMYAAKRATEVG
jgi:diguanylate cyclase (GGDEF)-like protein